MGLPFTKLPGQSCGAHILAVRKLSFLGLVVVAAVLQLVLMIMVVSVFVAIASTTTLRQHVHCHITGLATTLVETAEVRLSELPCRPREWDTRALSKQCWFELVGHGLVHDGAIPVSIDVGL